MGYLGLSEATGGACSMPQTRQSGDGEQVAYGHPRKTLTQSEMVLVSFYKLSGGSTNRVDYDELVLQAWKDWRPSFSLRNHPEYPDSADIHKRLYQTLASAGFVVSLRNKFFRLTDKGVAEGARLIATINNKSSPSDNTEYRLSRSEKTFIQQATASRAFAVWQSGYPDKLVDHDARMFFQFSTGTPVKDRRLKRDSARETIAKAQHTGIAGSEELEKLANYLSATFSGLFEERNYDKSR